MKFKHIPGRALWKFVFGEVPYYRPSNVTAIGYFNYNLHLRFKIYVRNNISGGWDYVTENIPSDICQCGRAYTDTHNGLEFRHKSIDFIDTTTIAGCKEAFLAPVLCQVCFYSIELAEGRFCPKWVKEQLSNK